MSKLYFETVDGEFCYDLGTIKDRMRIDEIKEKTVFLAKKDDSIKNDYFWCRAVGEVGEKGHCGKDCSDYEPRNGKSGCCKYFASTYYASEEIKIIKL